MVVVRLWAPATGLRAPNALSGEREVWPSPQLGGRPHGPCPGILSRHVRPRATRCPGRAGRCGSRGRWAPPPHNPGPRLHPAALGSRMDPADTPAVRAPGVPAPWCRAGACLRSEGRRASGRPAFQDGSTRRPRVGFTCKVKINAEEQTVPRLLPVTHPATRIATGPSAAVTLGRVRSRETSLRGPSHRTRTHAPVSHTWLGQRLGENSVWGRIS